MELDILSFEQEMHCEELHIKVDQDNDLKAIISIHDTVLGPALGGCRFIEYSSSIEALRDSIRLAQDMAYKTAICKLPFSGGKMVLIKPKSLKDRKAYFKAVGKFIESLNGRYITAIDSGTSTEDMDIIATQTKHLTSTTIGKHNLDPSIFSAKGIARGILAAVKFKLGKESLKGVHVAIQGLGHAGYQIAKRLHEEGAKLTVYDINNLATERVLSEFGAKAALSADDLMQTECDVLSPCALGSVINDRTLNFIKAPIIAGCANNQLETPLHGLALMHKDILFAPDYAINAGGLIYCALQMGIITENELNTKIDQIYDTLWQIFTLSKKENKPTNEIADTIAKEYILSKKNDLRKP